MFLHVQMNLSHSTKTKWCSIGNRSKDVIKSVQKTQNEFNNFNGLWKSMPELGLNNKIIKGSEQKSIAVNDRIIQ